MPLPPLEEISRVIVEQNPWWNTGHVPEILAPKTERPLVGALGATLLGDRPLRYEVVLGPRRVGKTTVMYQTVRRLLNAAVPAQRLAWLRLDHPYLLPINLGDLVEVLRGISGAEGDQTTYVFLDELVYADQWDRWLKTFFDDRLPVKIVGTSSATAALHERRIESGVGRWEEQFLAPYHLSEYLELDGSNIRIDAESTLADTMTKSLIVPTSSYAGRGNSASSTHAHRWLSRVAHRDQKGRGRRGASPCIPNDPQERRRRTSCVQRHPAVVRRTEPDDARTPPLRARRTDDGCALAGQHHQRAWSNSTDVRQVPLLS